MNVHFLEGFVDEKFLCEFYTFITPGAVAKNATIGSLAGM
jgi:hypothetical protein